MVPRDLRLQSRSAHRDHVTEHFNAVSAYDRNVAGLLEMMGVPYTGSSPTGLTLCKNKGMAKELLAYHKIRVPNFAVFSPGGCLRSRGIRGARWSCLIMPAASKSGRARRS